MCNYTYIGLISCDILKHYGYLTHAQNRSMVIETERYSDTDSITRAIARLEISCPKWHQHWYGPRESFYSLLRNDQHIIESTNPSDCIIDLTAIQFITYQLVDIVAKSGAVILYGISVTNRRFQDSCLFHLWLLTVYQELYWCYPPSIVHVLLIFNGDNIVFVTPWIALIALGVNIRIQCTTELIYHNNDSESPIN